MRLHILKGIAVLVLAVVLIFGHNDGQGQIPPAIGSIDTLVVQDTAGDSLTNMGGRIVIVTTADGGIGISFGADTAYFVVDTGAGVADAEKKPVSGNAIFDHLVATYLALAGGKMSGDINFDGTNIDSVGHIHGVDTLARTTIATLNLGGEHGYDFPDDTVGGPTGAILKLDASGNLVWDPAGKAVCGTCAEQYDGHLLTAVDDSLNVDYLGLIATDTDTGMCYIDRILLNAYRDSTDFVGFLMAHQSAGGADTVLCSLYFYRNDSLLHTNVGLVVSGGITATAAVDADSMDMDHLDVDVAAILAAMTVEGDASVAGNLVGIDSLYTDSMVFLNSIYSAAGDINLNSGDIQTVNGLVSGLTGVFGSSLNIPNASDVTTDAEGEIGWDNDDDMLEVYSGNESESVVIPIYRTIQGTLFNPDGLTDSLPIYDVGALQWPGGIEIDSIQVTTSVDGVYALGFIAYSNADPPVLGEWIDTLNVGASDQKANSATFTDAAIEVGKTIYASIPATDIDWVKFTIWFHGKDFN